MLQGKSSHHILTLSRGIGITVFLLFMWHLCLLNLLGFQQDANQQFINLIQHKKTEITQFIARETHLIELEKRLQFIANLRDQNLLTAKLLTELNHATPVTITLNHLQRNGDAIMLEGNAASSGELVRFMENIAKSPVFLQPVMTDALPNGVQDFKFILKISMRT